MQFEAKAVSVSFVDILFKKFTVDIFSTDDAKLEHPIISHTLRNLYFYGNKKENFIHCDIDLDLDSHFPIPNFLKNYEFILRYSFQWDLSCAWIPTSISHFIIAKETIYSPSDSFDIEYDTNGEVILVTRDPPIGPTNESSGDWIPNVDTYTLTFKANHLSFDSQFGPFTLDTVSIYSRKTSIILDIELLYKHEIEYLALSFPPCKFIVSLKSCNEHIDDQLIGYGSLDQISIDPNNRPARIRFSIEVPFDHHHNNLSNNTNFENTDSAIPGLSPQEFETFLSSTNIQKPLKNDSSIAMLPNLTVSEKLNGTPRKLQSIIRNYLTRRAPILISLMFKDVTDNKIQKWVNDQGGIRLKLKGNPTRSPSFEFYVSLIVLLGSLFDFYIDASHFILIMKHILRI